MIDPQLRHILLMLVGISNILLGIFVFLKNKKSHKHISFFIWALMLGLWSLCVDFFMNAISFKVAYFWINVIAMLTISLGASIFYLALVFTRENIKKYKSLIISSYLLIPFFALFYFIPNFFIKNIIFHEWGKENILGIGYYIIYVIFAIYFVVSICIFYIKYLKSIGTEKNQLLYILVSVLATLFLGTYFNWFLVLIGNYKYIWAGPLCSASMVVGTFYTVVNYRLMSIDLAWRYGAKYIGYIFFNIIFFLVILFSFKSFFNNYLTYSFILLCIFIFVTRNYLLNKIEAFFLRKQRYIWNELDKLSKNPTQSYDIRDIIKIVLIEVSEALELTHSSCYMLNESVDSYKLFLTSNGPLTVQKLELDNPIIEYLKQTKLKLYKEDIIALNQDTDFIEVLKDLKYEVYFPIFFNGELIGIICYGKKKGNILYHKQDLEYLENIIEKTQFEIINVKMLENLSHEYAAKFMRTFKDRYTNDIMNSIQHLGRAKTLPEFCEAMDKLLVNAINPKAITIYIYNEFIEEYEYQEIKIRGRKEERRQNQENLTYPNLGPIHRTIKENSAIISYLKERKDVLRIEDIEEWSLKSGAKELVGTADLLHEMQGNLVGALFQSTFLGFIVVGNKKDNQKYTDEEIRLLGLLFKIAPLMINTISLRDKALKDSLMGIYNKGFLMRRLSDEIVFTSKDGKPLSIVMIDIDFFKNFNTTLGHLKADEVLEAMGRYLKQFLREGDEVFRYGGEEIVIILSNTAAKDAKYLAERINLGVKEDLIFLELKKRHKIGITISAGVATLKDVPLTDDLSNREIKNLRDKLIEAADDQLYISKDDGRDRVSMDKEYTREELLIRQKIKKEKKEEKRG